MKIYKDLKALKKNCESFYDLIEESEESFRIKISQAAILIQLKKAIDKDTMSLLMKTNFFTDGHFVVDSKNISLARTILVQVSKNCKKCRADEQLERIPEKIKFLNLLTKYDTVTESNKKFFCEMINEFILHHYYYHYDDTIVKLDEDTMFLKKYIEGSKNYELENGYYYFKRYRTIEEKMKKFVLEGKAIFLSGKAGTGKTTKIQDLTMQYFNKRMTILAPTNAAVMRLKSIIVEDDSKISGPKINTIHSMYYSQNAAPCDIMVIDESSMLSTDLVGMVLKIYELTKPQSIIFVGDYRQLPPVGKGNFFKTVVTQYPKSVPHTQLTKVHRQESADILKLANIFANDEVSNYRFSIDQICDMVKSDSIEVHNYKGYGAKMAKQLALTSEYNETHHMVAYTNAVVNQMNDIAYTKLTNRSYSYKDRKRYLIKNLKLRATTTNITKKRDLLYANNQYVEVMGWTASTVNLRDIFTNKTVNVSIKDLNSDFKLGYCSTIHTAQGLGFDTVDFFMNCFNYTINKELYYTAITRAKKKLNLIKNEYNNHHLCYILYDRRHTFY